MRKDGPIIIIEDDKDDQMMLTEVFAELGNANEVMFFTDGLVAYDYLTVSKVRPF